MLIALWTLLHVALLVGFFVISVHAFSLLRIKFGVAVAAIFALGLLSFIGRSEKYKPPPDKMWKSERKDSTFADTRIVDVTLEKSSFAKVELSVIFSMNKNGDLGIPTTAGVYPSGLTGGLTWKTIDIQISPTNKKNEYRYQVEAIRTWSLIAVSVYAQPKSFSGIVEFKSVPPK